VERYVHCWLLEQLPPRRTHSPTQHLSIYLLLYLTEGEVLRYQQRTGEVQRETTGYCTDCHTRELSMMAIVGQAGASSTIPFILPCKEKSPLWAGPAVCA
jgi:hypothetical protein